MQDFTDKFKELQESVKAMHDKFEKTDNKFTNLRSKVK